jgi:hypothetical protein
VHLRHFQRWQIWKKKLLWWKNANLFVTLLYCTMHEMLQKSSKIIFFHCFWGPLPSWWLSIIYSWDFLCPLKSTCSSNPSNEHQQKGLISKCQQALYCFTIELWLNYWNIYFKNCFFFFLFETRGSLFQCRKNITINNTLNQTGRTCPRENKPKTRATAEHHSQEQDCRPQPLPPRPLSFFLFFSFSL